jgi:hypothetical protein
MRTKFLSEILKGRDFLEDLGVDGNIILKWILEKQGGMVRTGFIWLRIGTNGGTCEHGNGPKSCIKGVKFLTSLATVSFLRKTVLHVVS